MRTVLLAAMLVLGAAAGCNRSTTEPSNDDAYDGYAEYDDYISKIPVITVGELDKQLAAGTCTPIDANGARVRVRMGVVPGAVLLSDSDTYNMAELPADKARPLAFYCSNNYCTSSHEAAHRAMVAGYQNVKVMEAGIAGWAAAGKQVQKL